MTNSVVHFEYPLNEKMRSWLRLEYLLNQLSFDSGNTSQGAYLHFFRTLSELLDIFERSELRADIVKELERQQQKLQQWQLSPDVNQPLIHQLTQQLQDSATALINSPRFGQSFKEDRFLSQIRQRLNIPGGYCSFDIPALHLWLQLPEQRRSTEMTQWLDRLTPLENSLSLIMNLIRQSSGFSHCHSQKGFYQDTAEGADLLRLRISQEYEIYPQISGHKHRYAIRFLSLLGDEHSIPDVLPFELACC